jgi:hypothetical protein
LATLLGTDNPILFLGLADHIQKGATPFPIGNIDLFRLSHHKAHIIYPALIQSNAWVFLVDLDFLTSRSADNLTISIDHEDGTLLGSLTIQSIDKGDSQSLTQAQAQPAVLSALPPGTARQEFQAVLGASPFTVLSFSLDSIANKPGPYIVRSKLRGVSTDLGTVYFHYNPASSLTPDEIQAIKADPAAAKAIQFEMGCKFCTTKLRVYTALSHQPRIEKEGWIWYADTGDKFQCECGKTDYSLRYIRESMAGLLRKDFSLASSGLNYVRQYGHEQVVSAAQRFKELLSREDLEPPVQMFLEQNPVLFARFHARRLFKKPSILGQFQADFAIVDSQGELWLIEIERPTLKLFKKDGHPTGKLMHAYEQVKDWLHKYNKHPGAVLEALKLHPDEIVAVRGAVIAGRSESVSHEVLQRHHMAPPYPRIEFLTFDDLAASLIQLSRKLA